MNRREWLKTSGAVSARSLLVNFGTISDMAAESSSCVWETSITRLNLRHCPY